MLQPNEYRAHAQKAYDDVEYYEAEAERSDEPRRSTLPARSLPHRLNKQLPRQIAGVYPGSRRQLA